MLVVKLSGPSGATLGDPKETTRVIHGGHTTVFRLVRMPDTEVNIQKADPSPPPPPATTRKGISKPWGPYRKVAYTIKICGK